AAREAGGDAVPHERGDRAEDQTDERRHHDGVATAPRGHPLCGRRREDRRRLDLLRLEEELARAEPVLLRRREPELEEELVGGREPALLERVVDERDLLLVDRDLLREVRD